ncbi:MAG: alpha-glucosidase/alpha-galactosidase [Candidatus Bathyarchaeia archaeon]
MTEVKISIIGAGSATFSLALIKDLCLTSNLDGSAISFMDVNVERLNAVYKLCRRYADEMGRRLNLSKTLNRRESLRDADFVINTALVIGYSGYRRGWSLGFKHGYRFGGSFHIMHDEGFWINFYQLRLFDSIIDDMLEVCPDAWYIQLANPVLAGTTYLGRKYRKLKMVGLCHGFRGIYHIADVLGLERNSVEFEIPGVNHFVWLTKFHHKSKDAYPLLDKWIEKEAPRYWERCPPSDDLGPKAIDLYKRFGIFPIGDTCTPGGGSWPWWYHTDEETERRWKEDPKSWWKWVLEPSQEDSFSKIIKVTEDQNTNVTSVFPPEKSGEIFAPLIESIACDIPRIFPVNIINSEDLVPGVPRDFEVEVPALVNRKGIEGIRTDALPKPLINYILRDRVAPVEIELEAYESGSKERLLELIMMDPWTRSEEQAKSLLDDVLAIPVHEEMRQHYR